MKLKMWFAGLGLLFMKSVAAQESHPPVAVPFSLKEPGYVTLVIEDQNGQRVRNLISETWFKAGKNTVWWDGLDDLGRDADVARQSVYAIPPGFVSPGTYTIRGLVHQAIGTRYEFSVYASGNPPWSTKDHTGGWMANHTPPQAAAFVPASASPTHQPVVFLGSYITEGPDGLIWVDLDGKKLGGRTWVGGAWTAAPYIARDEGNMAVPGVSVYIAAVWETAGNSGQGTIRINSLPKNPDKPILTEPIGPLSHDAVTIMTEIGGFAVRNGIGIVSLTKKNQLVCVDLKNGKTLGRTSVAMPAGLAFDPEGRLLVLSGDTLLRFSAPDAEGHLSSALPLITSRLESPAGIATDPDGNLFISNGGKSHQVMVFTGAGKFIRAIGKAGPPQAGAYDPLHMNHPAGVTIDSRKQLWVTENDGLPKRVSVWSTDGKLIRAFYGPAKYGGGGALDPQDKTKYYYADQELGTMEFKLDWKNGSSVPDRILYRKTTGMQDLPVRNSAPETALYHEGKRYFTNAYNSNPTGGSLSAVLFREQDGVLQPAAAMGRADTWPILKEPAFRVSYPPMVDLNAKGPNALAFFIWSDLNGDGRAQPDEVTFQKGEASGVTVMPDLSFAIAQLNGSAVQFSPQSFTASGVPVYGMDKRKVLATGVQPPGSSGGDQVLTAPDGWTVITLGISPFSSYSVSGAKNGRQRWSYPDLWPGLHASHEAPLPVFKGELIGTTRLPGGIFRTGPAADPLWALNSNHGMIYIFTTDGLFVTTLFEPMRTGKAWDMPAAQRGMDLKGITLGEENFWPSVTAFPNGEVYLVDGGRSSLVRVTGLETISRLPAVQLSLSADDLKKSVVFQKSMEQGRQQLQGMKTLAVLLQPGNLKVDGKDDDWKNVQWAEIVKGDKKANPVIPPLSAAVTVSGGKLYAFYHTGDAALLRNSFEIPSAPFKTGGALDLMIGSAAGADPKRRSPVAGDQRLLVTMSNGRPRAVLYKAVVPGTKPADRVPFSSPWRTIMFDSVTDVSSQLEFAAGSNGDFEIAVPLNLLDLNATPGLSVKGDIGVLRGDGSKTVSRLYWSNKATAIVSDVPSEAELSPALWGNLEFKIP